MSFLTHVGLSGNLVVWEESMASTTDQRPRRNIAITFGMEKLEWCGYLMVKKFDDMFSRLDTVLACDRQTDGQTDIMRQHSPRYA